MIFDRTPVPQTVARKIQSMILEGKLGMGMEVAADRHEMRREPLGGVEVQLLARNNEILGSARTDADGHAVFMPGLTRGAGGLTPARQNEEKAPRERGFS